MKCRDEGRRIVIKYCVKFRIYAVLDVSPDFVDEP